MDHSNISCRKLAVQIADVFGTELGFVRTALQYVVYPLCDIRPVLVLFIQWCHVVIHVQTCAQVLSYVQRKVSTFKLGCKVLLKGSLEVAVFS